MSSLSIVHSIVAGATMISLVRCPSTLRKSSTFFLPGVGRPYSSDGDSHVSGKGLKHSASVNQMIEESLDEKDDFFTPEMQTSDYFHENQTSRTLGHPDTTAPTVVNSTEDIENVSLSTIDEDHSTGAAGRRTVQQSTSAKDEETKEPEATDEDHS